MSDITVTRSNLVFGRPSLLARGGRAVVLGAACLAVILPFIAVISTSLASQAEISRAGGFVFWVTDPTLDAYRAVLSGGVVTRSVIVSLGIAGVGTALSVLCTIGLAYALSRTSMYAQKPMLLAVLFTLLFSPGMIPMYLVVKQLGLIDSYWALILPVLINAFNVIVMREFFLDLPAELMESAKIDGAGEFLVLTRIVLPLSKAVIAVIALFYAVAYWNSFFNALLYINSPEKWPLQLVLRTYVVNETPMGVDDLAMEGSSLPPQVAIQMAILLISVLPMLIVYPFIQKHFTKGLLIGGVKG
ncbi:carbohydrate ABC transporter permease [Occultella aeris]|uniref:L-arabinose transport system permease protein AraQ n=1 Tax=Occultella aeris TaxID=2761496 RepID=A0A7M4DF40_9MICO|nr:carbohydrate ABC transporter permease [Occultella aeris]VZO35533.1 L-arabinose transport system permease protein AraQ [Occultella aeris]